MSLFSDWTIIDDGEMDAQTFNLSTSSISASDSFTKDDFGLMTYEGFSGNFDDTKLEKTEPFGTSPLLEASTGSLEPVMGLKLGKRIYFENSPSTTSSKKTKSPSQNPRCIVEGCNFDLSKAKEYHRKHRVCDAHSKSSKVVVGGLERRFCQQCSRFHNLSEFDEKKRSCRRRLFDHNARRRKPYSSPFYGGSQRTSLLFNNTAWDNTSSSKFTLTKGCASSKPIGYGFSNEQMHTRMQGFVDMQSNEAAPEYGRALSLLSTNSSVMPLIPEGVPLSSPQVSHRSTSPRLQPNSDADFHENQLLITPYHNHLYSNIIN